MPFGEFGARNGFRETRDTSLLYAGHAMKPMTTAPPPSAGPASSV